MWSSSWGIVFSFIQTGDLDLPSGKLGKFIGKHLSHCIFCVVCRLSLVDRRYIWHWSRDTRREIKVFVRWIIVRFCCLTFWLVPLLMYLWRMPLFCCLTTVHSSQISHHSGCISCFRFMKKLMLMKVYLTKWCPINCMFFFFFYQHNKFMVDSFKPF